MKVTNWRRKLAASLLAAGLISPSAAYAAGLDTNLVVNPSFETVGPTLCCFNASEINTGWTDGTQTGFAYNYNQVYDNGNPLAGGGSFYFSPNANGPDGGGKPDITAPGQVSQLIDVSTGATATQIASGEAAVKFSAYFSSYLTDGDFGHLNVQFLNAGNASLGSADIDGHLDTSTWIQRKGAAFIPVGTSKIKASVYGTPRSGGPDGYTDLTDVQVTTAVSQLLFAEVNTTNGQVTIKNQTGAPVHIDYYEIKSGGTAGDYNDDGVVNSADYTRWRDALNTNTTLPNDSTPGTVTAADFTVWKNAFNGGNILNATNWLGLQEQNVAGFPPGNGSGNGWEESGGSDANLISETYLTNNSIVANNAAIGLGQAFNVGGAQNLEFRYGVVSDNGLGQFVGTSDLVRGFVRYVTSGAGSGGTSVPEPSSVVLIGMGLASLLVYRRREEADN